MICSSSVKWHGLEVVEAPIRQEVAACGRLTDSSSEKAALLIIDIAFFGTVYKKILDPEVSLRLSSTLGRHSSNSSGNNAFYVDTT